MQKSMLKPKCIKLKKCEKICVDPKCKKNPFICKQQTCSCNSNHEQCQYFQTTQYVAKQVFGHRIIAQQQFQVIDQTLQTIIKQIERVRVQYAIRKQTYGFTQKQTELYNKIKYNQYSDITGSYIRQVMEHEKSFYYKIQLKEVHLKQINLITKLLVDLLQNIAPGYAQFKSKYSIPLIPVELEPLQKKQIKFDRKLLDQYFFPKKIGCLRLLYRASEHNYQVNKFWERCNIAHTLIVIQTQYGKTIGAYTPLKWDNFSNDHLEQDRSGQSCIFSLSYKQKIPIKNKKNALYHLCCYGPVLGSDLYISKNANIFSTSMVSIGNDYGVQGTIYNQQYITSLTGNQKGNNFRISEWEVYQLIFQGN